MFPTLAQRTREPFDALRLLRAGCGAPSLYGLHVSTATLAAMHAGFATAEGTSRYRERFPLLAEAGHFRQAEHVPGVRDLWCPSIGLGTYLGEPDERAD